MDEKDLILYALSFYAIATSPIVAAGIFFTIQVFEILGWYHEDVKNFSNKRNDE